jgi:GT2 family glycosyltransferase
LIQAKKELINLNSKVSLIIVSFNVKELLKECLDNLFSKDISFPLEIIVVDNASTDGTVEMLTRDISSKVKKIFNKNNFGFARACNQGAKLSSGGQYLFLNPDTIVRPEQIQKLSEYLSMHPDVGILGPRILNKDGSLQLTCGPIPSPRGTMFEALRLSRISSKLFGGYQYMSWAHDTPRKVGWVSGACLLIGRELFHEEGGFDENFLLYAEDVDLCIRIGRQGFKVLYWPEVCIIHLGAQSSRKVRSQALVMGYQSKLYYLQKHHGRIQCVGLRAIFILSSILTVIAALTAALLNRNNEYIGIARAHLMAAVQLLSLQIPRGVE